MRVWGGGFWVWGSGFGVEGLGFRIWGTTFMVEGLEFEIWGLGFGVQGSWFRRHRRAGSLSSFTAIRKEAGLFCGTLPRKGEVFAYVAHEKQTAPPKATTGSYAFSYCNVLRGRWFL